MNINLTAFIRRQQVSLKRFPAFSIMCIRIRCFWSIVQCPLENIQCHFRTSCWSQHQVQEESLIQVLRMKYRSHASTYTFMQTTYTRHSSQTRMKGPARHPQTLINFNHLMLRSSPKAPDSNVTTCLTVYGYQI